MIIVITKCNGRRKLTNFYFLWNDQSGYNDSVSSYKWGQIINSQHSPNYFCIFLITQFMLNMRRLMNYDFRYSNITAHNIYIFCLFFITMLVATNKFTQIFYCLKMLGSYYNPDLKLHHAGLIKYAGNVVTYTWPTFIVLIDQSKQ